MCLEIFGLSLFMDYECACCCHFQTEFCTNTTGCDGNNLEVILKFVCYKYDDIRISATLPYNIRSVQYVNAMQILPSPFFPVYWFPKHSHVRSATRKIRFEISGNVFTGNVDCVFYMIRIIL
jgi:hypothetical protein